MNKRTRILVGIVIGVVIGVAVGTAAGLLQNQGWGSVSKVLVVITPGIIGGLVSTMLGRKPPADSSKA